MYEVELLLTETQFIRLEAERTELDELLAFALKWSLEIRITAIPSE